MKKLNIAARVLLWACLPILVSCSKKIDVSDDKVTLNGKNYHVILNKKSDNKISGLIFGCQTGEQIQPGVYYDARISYVTMDDVEWIKKVRSDYYMCKSPAAQLAKDQMKNAVLVAANEDGSAKIRELQKLFFTSQNRIRVDISGAFLDIEEYKENGKLVKFLMRPEDNVHYFVENIEYEVITQ